MVKLKFIICEKKHLLRIYRKVCMILVYESLAMAWKIKGKGKTRAFRTGNGLSGKKNVQTEKRKIIWEKQNKPILYIIKEGKVRSGCGAAACLEIKREVCLPSVVMTAYRMTDFQYSFTQLPVPLKTKKLRHVSTAAPFSVCCLLFAMFILHRAETCS